MTCAGDNLICHPELGATHVATCVNVGDTCTDYLKSFSGSINVDFEPLTIHLFITIRSFHVSLLTFHSNKLTIH